MDTAARLLKLLTLLQTRPHWTGEALAARLGTTVRTLRRDVVRLRGLGYPVDADPGVAGGYRLGTGGRLPPLLLAEDEAVAIAVGLRVATATTVLGIEEAVVAALTKLDALLPPRLRERVAAVRAGTVQMRGPQAPGIDPDVLVVLATGCRDGQGLRFGYVDNQGRATRRSAEPLRVVHTGRRWYLVAWDHDRSSWRTFRVDRVSGPALTGSPVRFTDPPDPVALVAESAGVAPFDIEARILVYAPAEVVRRVLPPMTGPIEAIGTDRCVVRAGANELDPLVRFACELPFDFEVLGPPELRSRLARLGEQLVRRHS